jgi:FAD-dependent urate hydroxylase
MAGSTPIWGRQAFFGYTVRADGEAWWFANIGRKREPDAERLAAVRMKSWRLRLVEVFADDPDLIAWLIERTQRITATTIHDMPAIPRWYDERVVLIGDSAHAVSPSSGQGASLAIEDAIVLAKCLRDVTPVSSAFARYVELRRPRAEKMVATGRKRGAYKAPRNPLTLWLRDLLMPAVFKVFRSRQAGAHTPRTSYYERPRGIPARCPPCTTPDERTTCACCIPAGELERTSGALRRCVPQRC